MNTSVLPRLIMILVAVTLLVTGCKAPVEQELSIPELKGSNWQNYIGKKVVVEGVFVRDPLPMLVTDIRHVLSNMPIPKDQFIALVGGIAEEIEADEYGGAKVKVRGVTKKAPDDDKYKDQVVIFQPDELTLIERIVKYNPKILRLTPQAGPVMPNRYAILYSGGCNDFNNSTRYWNDLVFMYATLKKLGFPEKNMAILYADGKAKNKDMPVHYAATQANLTQVFNLLKTSATNQDLVFFFTTNHGGGFEQQNKTSPIAGGALDTSADEGTEPIFEKDYKQDFNGNGSTLDQVAWDEDMCTWGGHVSDDAINGMLQGITYKTMIIVLEQCFGGGFIRDSVLPGANKIVMSASSQFEPSFVLNTGGGSYDEFSYHFTAALNGATPTGTKADADANNDGKVSMVEAFNYAWSNDSWVKGNTIGKAVYKETPQYEDSGDGVSHTGKMPAHGEGTLGDSTYLK